MYPGSIFQTPFQAQFPHLCWQLWNTNSAGVGCRGATDSSRAQDRQEGKRQTMSHHCKWHEKDFLRRVLGTHFLFPESAALADSSPNRLVPAPALALGPLVHAYSAPPCRDAAFRSLGDAWGQVCSGCPSSSLPVAFLFYFLCSPPLLSWSCLYSLACSLSLPLWDGMYHFHRHVGSYQSSKATTKNRRGVQRDRGWAVAWPLICWVIVCTQPIGFLLPTRRMKISTAQTFQKPSED